MLKPDADEKTEAALQEPFYHQNPKYKCCGIHAKKGVLIMACALIVASLVLVGIAIWIQIYSLIGVAAFIVLLCVLIFVGNKKEQEYLYLPFLFCAVLFAISLAAFAIFLIVMLLEVPEFWRNYTNLVFAHKEGKSEEETVSSRLCRFIRENRPGLCEEIEQKAAIEHLATARVVTAVLLAASLVLLAITVWLAQITLKAYYYLKEMHIARHPHKVYHINGTNGANGSPQEITTIVETVA